MKTFPVMLIMQDKLSVVVGAGPVGCRKAATLQRAGANVRLVTGTDAPALDIPGVEIIRQPYRREHLAGAFIVFACTDNTKLNAQIVAEARLAGALANAADQPQDCDFFSPAVLDDGDVVLALSTGGSSPGLLQMLKARAKDILPERIGEFAALLDEFRCELKRTCDNSRHRMTILKQLSSADSYDLFIRSGDTAIRGQFNRLYRELREQD